ncbi:hypothetical protein SLE2022_018020 [Rubroshorea leprosula]
MANALVLLALENSLGNAGSQDATMAKVSMDGNISQILDPTGVFTSTSPLSYRDRKLLEEKSIGISFSFVSSYLIEDFDANANLESDISIILLSKVEKC